MQRCVALALACGVQAIRSPDYSDPGRLWNWLKTDGTAAEPSAEPSDSSSSVDDLFKPHKEDAHSNPFLDQSHDGSSDLFRPRSSGVDELFKPHRHHHEGGEFEPLSKDDLFKPRDDAPAPHREEEPAESSESSGAGADMGADSGAQRLFSAGADMGADSGADSLGGLSGGGGSANSQADGSVVVTVNLDSQFLQKNKKGPDCECIGKTQGPDCECIGKATK